MARRGWGSLCPLAIALMVWVPAGVPLMAADRITARLGEFERSVSVASLAGFARDGEIDADLRFYLDRLTPAQRRNLRTALNGSAPVTAVMVSNFLATDLGQRILQQLVKVLDQSPAVAESALSSALILAAAPAGELRMIDVLEAYPLSTLRLNLVAVLALAEQVSHELNLENQLYARLAALGAAPSAAEPKLGTLAETGPRRYGAEPFAFTGRKGTTIEALAYVPEGPGPFPLVVLAPGLNSEMNALLYLGQHLASHGYAVAALNFPFTSGTEIRGIIQGTGSMPNPNSWASQPHSVSDLIDQVQIRWGERVDTAAVGVLGQSLGGYTVIALAGAQLDWDHLRQACTALGDPHRLVLNPAVLWQCLAPGEVVERQDFRDPRVRAAVAVNPVTNPIFSAASMGDVAVPLLMIAGSNDLFAPPVSQQLLPYTAITQPDSLLVLQQHGTHLSFLNGDAPLPAFLIGPDRPLARQNLQALSRVFFDRHLRQAREVAPLLQSAEADTGTEMGVEPLPLLLRPQLSQQQLRDVVPDQRLTPR